MDAGEGAISTISRLIKNYGRIAGGGGGESLERIAGASRSA